MKTIDIFLVDDDVDDCEVFVEALEEIPLNTSVEIFTNVANLLAHLKSGKSLPHVLFLDLHMPVVDGFECLHEIRSKTELSAIAIFIYATSYFEDEVRDLLEIGANRCIQKPNSFDVLKKLLLRSLKPFVNQVHGQKCQLDYRFSA